MGQLFGLVTSVVGSVSWNLLSSVSSLGAGWREGP